MTPRSQGLADATVVAKVNSVLWDLDRPLEEDCSLQLVKFDDDEGELFTPSPPSPPSHPHRAAGVLALECAHPW